MDNILLDIISFVSELVFFTFSTLGVGAILLGFFLAFLYKYRGDK